MGDLHCYVCKQAGLPLTLSESATYRTVGASHGDQIQRPVGTPGASRTLIPAFSAAITMRFRRQRMRKKLDRVGSTQAVACNNFLCLSMHVVAVADLHKQKEPYVCYLNTVVLNRRPKRKGKSPIHTFGL